jgi:hypothetical protein
MSWESVAHVLEFEDFGGVERAEEYAKSAATASKIFNEHPGFGNVRVEFSCGLSPQWRLKI